MSKVAVFGATGYAGSNIVDELLSRGHEVVAVARNVSALVGRAGVLAIAGSVADEGVVSRAVDGADAIVAALPSHTDEITLSSAVTTLLDVASLAGSRLGVVGGAGNLRVSDDGPLLAETEEFPAALVSVAAAHTVALATLRGSAETVDWFYFSPAGGFGSHNPGKRIESFRLGGTLLLSDEQGASEISGADYAIAFVDEIEHPQHHREQFTAAY